MAKGVGSTTCLLNVCGEVWKYENVYLRAYENGTQLRRGLTEYFGFYNTPENSPGSRLSNPG